MQYKSGRPEKESGSAAEWPKSRVWGESILLRVRPRKHQNPKKKENNPLNIDAER